jgi:hypothetical protein
MSKLLFLFAFVVAGIAAAQAMPLHRVQGSDLIISVASGCGLGVHRGRYDGCYPVYSYYADYYRGYRNAYYAGPVSGGVCGGRGTHLACNYYGMCWVACN